MNIKLISDLGDEPLSVDEAHIQVNYTGADQDTYLAGLITAARIQAEIHNGRLFTLQQWDLALDNWPGSSMVGISAVPNPYFGFWPSDAYRLLGGMPSVLNSIALPAPLVSVESMTWKDTAAVVHPLTENTHYVVDTWKEPGIICPAPNTMWPSGGLWPSSAIHVQFTAGMVPDAAAYAAANPAKAPALAVRRNIRMGMLLLISEWFENRVPLEITRGTAVPVPGSVISLFTSDKLWV